MELVRLGFEVGTGKEVKIPLAHSIFTGVTQMSGKTTGIESIVKRSGKRAVAFVTKVGEQSFQEGTLIKPFYRERSDWEFIKGLIEGTFKYRIRAQEQAKIIQLTRESGGNSLTEFKKKLDEKLISTKSDYKLDIYTNLHAYLEKIIPRIYDMDYTKELNLVDGINIIDLEKFASETEIQALVIASVLDEVLTKYEDVIVIIPELWKFSPQDKGTPCKWSIESFARQGAAKGNFLCLDSQEMASTDKSALKQCSNWIMGYQAETNEVKHTLAQLPIPKSKKPSEDEIMSLKTGEFFVATRDFMKKVFVQAPWISESDARDVALGNKTIQDLPQRQKVKRTVSVTPKNTSFDEGTSETLSRVEFRKIFDDAIKNLNNDWTSKFSTFTYKVELMNKEKHLGKMSEIDKSSLINEILAKMPKTIGQNTVYNVSPIEKIKKDFLEVAKNKIMEDVQSLGDKAKQMLKYIESRGVGVAVNELCLKCFLMKSGEGGYAKQVKEYGMELTEKLLANKHQNGKFEPVLKERIKSLIDVHGATEKDVEQVYDHIIIEIIGDKK